jgi:hypothetical protein
VNAGVYRFSQGADRVTPVVTPGVTLAPGGELFAGAHFGASLNNQGDVGFAGMVPTDQGIHLPDEAYIGQGAGLFKANKQGEISSIIGPGDPAPGGGVFDWTIMPWINDGGDVAFWGHAAGEECRAEGSPPQAILIRCLSSIYVSVPRSPMDAGSSYAPPQSHANTTISATSDIGPDWLSRQVFLIGPKCFLRTVHRGVWTLEVPRHMGLTRCGHPRPPWPMQGPPVPAG